MSIQKDYLLLPSDRDFIEFFNERHGIKISEKEYQEIALQYHIVEQDWKKRLANDETVVFYDVQDGRVVAIVAFAAIGFFAAPLLGVGALTGALIGASIGYRLFGGNQQQQKQKQNKNNSKDQQVTPTFGFNSAPGVTPIGGTVPLVFTNKVENPNGGVRISGVVIYSNVNTFGGVQRLYTKYGICAGRINFINENKILINGQPRDNFFTNEIQTYTRLGTDTQAYVDGFSTYYSQCVTLSNNNQLGISKKGKHIGGNITGTTITVSSDDIDNFIPSENYNANGQDFRIVSKNPNNNTLQTDKVITLGNNTDIFGLNSITYTTSKKCSEIQLNFVANLWARNADNDLLQHGILFAVYVDTVFVGRFIFASKTESDIRRQIKIKNLAITKHKIQIFAINGTDSANGVYYCSDGQQMTEVDTGIVVQNRVVFIEYEQSPNVSLNVSQINAIVDLNKKQTSSDRGAVVQLTTVNEIIYPSNLGHSYLSNNKGIVTASLIATASNRLQSDPSPSWLIEGGCLGRSHLAAGVANNNSTPNQLQDISANFLNDTIQPNLSILRNLDKGVESSITTFTNNTITTSQQLYWTVGDRYLVYNPDQSLCRFPDIYVWSLTSKRGGLGAMLPGTQIADYFIDYPTIVAARKFCVINNFFWDGVVDDNVNWQQWASTESMASLLFPTRYGGKFGLIPEGSKAPVALFNASNILPDTYSEEYAPEQKLNCVHLTYTDNSDDVPREKTITVMTNNVYFGVDTLFAESLKFESITNEAQAIKIAQVFLKSRLLQDRVIRFDTALQGYLIREGDFIIVQHLTTEIEKECSGFVLESISYNNGTQKILLSAPSQIGLNAQYSAAVYRLETGTLQNNLVCYGIKEGNPSQNLIQIEGLTSELKPARDGFTGDYVIIGKDIPYRKTYRVQQIDPKENGSVSITAVLWNADILDASDLATIN